MHILSLCIVHFFIRHDLTSHAPFFIMKESGGVNMKFSLWNFRDWYEKHDIDLSYMAESGVPGESRKKRLKKATATAFAHKYQCYNNQPAFQRCHIWQIP